ncbi:MAG: GNAT family N-acetyltransferase [Armatimonadetes bacterium]|nr:GNAT family N-acetyltransferase [Armatimonadota bacterium]
MDPFTHTQEIEVCGRRLRFRPVRPGDEEALLAFIRERLSRRSQYLFRPHNPDDPEGCRREFAGRIARHGERHDLTLVVEQDGAVVGYCFLWGLDQGREGIPTLGIGLADALHGLGVGGAMMDDLIARARALGLRAIELTHESTNHRAARLYRSRGFVYTGEERPCGPDSARVERVMRLDLTAGQRTSR